MHFPTGAHHFLHLVYQQCYTDGGTTCYPTPGPIITCMSRQQWLPMLGQQFNMSGPMLAQQQHVIWVIGYIKVKNGLRFSVVNSSNDYGYIISYSL